MSLVVLEVVADVSVLVDGREHRHHALGLLTIRLVSFEVFGL